MAGVYRKMHIPDDPCYYEKFYFTPGDLGFRSIATSKGRLGVCVCWDQWFPEAARLTALAGAQILLYPTAIGWLAGEKDEYGSSQHAAWETMMRSHAIANGVFVGAANRIGHEGQIEFWGPRLSATRTAMCWLEPITAANSCCWSIARCSRLTSYARIGPSCATAASMPTKDCSGDTWTMTHTDTETETPRQLGYRWPAEWEPHRATWMAWPHNRATWPGGLEAARHSMPNWSRPSRALRPCMCWRVRVNRCDLPGGPGAIAHVELHDIPTNDAWGRDHGPVFLQRSARCLRPWSTGATTPGATSTRPSIWTTPFPPGSPNSPAAARFVADMILEGGRSKATDRECCSPPNPAC